MLRALLIRLVAFSFLLSSIPATAIDVPPCKGPGCSREAEKTPWPQPMEEKAFELLVSGTLIQLPSLPCRVAVVDGGLVVYDKHGGVFHVEAVTQKTLDELTPSVDRGDTTYSAAESGELIFTAKASDPPPSHPSDLFAWKRALFIKSQVFGETNPVLVSQKNGLKAYYFADKNGESMQAYVFQEGIEDEFLRVYGKGVTRELFESVVGSMKRRN